MSLVRVQSEEPNLRSLLSSRLFAFLPATLLCGRTSKVLAGPFVSLIPALTIPGGERQRVSFLCLRHRLAERRLVEGTQLTRVHVISLGAQQVDRPDAYLQMLGDRPLVETVGLAGKLDFTVQRLV